MSRENELNLPDYCPGSSKNMIITRRKIQQFLFGHCIRNQHNLKQYLSKLMSR